MALIAKLMREYKALKKILDSEEGKNAEPKLEQLELVQDNPRCWRLKASRFAEDGTKGGRDLNQDLARLAAEAPQHGGHLLMEITFPEDFPTQPFTIRVVTPRCLMYTGHVTAGGTVCIQALVATGQPGGWQPDFTVHSVLLLALQNMVDTEQVHIVTAANPMGGLTGPLRLDFSRGIRFTITPYTAYEAQAAHARALQHHARNGWGGVAGGAGSAAGSSAKASQRNAPVPAMAGAGAGTSSNAVPRPPSLAAPVGVGSPSGSNDAPRQLRKRPPPVPVSPPPGRKRAGTAGQQQGPSGSVLLVGPSMAGMPSLPPAGAQPGASAASLAAPMAVPAGALADTMATGSSKPARVNLSKGQASPAGVTEDVAGGVAAGPSGAAARAVIDMTAASPHVATTTAAGPSAPRPTAQLVLDLTMETDEVDLTAEVGSGALAVAPRPRQRIRPVSKSQDSDVELVLPSVAHRQREGQQRPRSGCVEVLDDSDDGSTDSDVQVVGVVPGRVPPLDKLVHGATVMGMDVASTGGGSAALAAALAAEQAQRIQLAAQLAELQQKAIAAAAPAPVPVAADPRLAAPTPPHWAPYQPGERKDALKLVILPLESDSQYAELYPAPLAASDRIELERQDALTAVQKQGVGYEDAQAALRYCAWNVQDAVLYAHQSKRKGGAARCVRALEREGYDLSGHEQRAYALDLERATREQEKEKKQLQDLKAEVERVLSRFEQHKGLARNLIRRIERVQHWPMWTKYTLRRHEVGHAIQSAPASAGSSHKRSAKASTAGGAANAAHEVNVREEQLWHGTDLATTATILHEGFDMRVANPNGSLGSGVYFAESSSYSLGYSMKPATVIQPNTGFSLPAIGRLLNPFNGSPSKPTGIPTVQTGAHSRPATRPHKWQGQYAMMLSRVVLGLSTAGAPGMRKPPPGHHSVNQASHAGNIYAVFDNMQSVPEYLVHFDPR